MPHLTIALINNMPDTALRATERQFRALLTGAASGNDIYLRTFLLSSQGRSEAALAYQRKYCEDIEELWDCGGIDGLIVTGAEARLPAIEDEPFWPILTKLLSWAEDHAASTMLSCHAAHAAVLFFDGVRRHPLPHKLFGLYQCAKAAEHPMMGDAPQCWVMPQSRYNDLSEEELAARGYTILSRSAEAGADIFAIERRRSFLFVQGHPEYDADTLFQEYRRDVRRFLTGERKDYPAMPENYFSASASAAFERFAALARRDIGLLAEFPEPTEENFAQAWRGPALQLYRNWISDLARRSANVKAQLASEWRS
jgi:homoserine O-succinyltransferase/O-acetyltransferase